MGRLYIDPMTLIKIDSKSGCWLWGGCLTHDGYPTKGKKYMHRVVYEMHKGPIPEGLTLDHVCRVRACCNPSHLQPMSLRENIAKGDYGWRNRLTHCKKGHEFTPENTIVRPTGGRNGGPRRACRECGRQASAAYVTKLKGLAA